MPGKKTKLYPVFVYVVDRPARKLILKRGVKAVHYLEFLDEVGANCFQELQAVKNALIKPCGMWLPKQLQKPGTSEYVQGVEVPEDYAGPVPAGYEMIGLKPCKMMVFQGPPDDFSDGTKIVGAIMDMWELLETYDPEPYGFAWADEDGPRLQLDPIANRGYTELLPVRQLDTKTQFPF